LKKATLRYNATKKGFFFFLFCCAALLPSPFFCFYVAQKGAKKKVTAT
jgi:hypothetical protein